MDLLALQLGKLRHPAADVVAVGIEFKKINSKKATDYDASHFQHPKFDADFEFWNAKSVWSVEEALILSLGKDPQELNAHAFSVAHSLLGQEFRRRQEEFCIETGLSLQGKMVTTYFVDWYHDHQYELPAAFGLGTDGHVNSRHSRKECEAIIADLRLENEGLRREIEKAQASPKKPDRTVSMQRMIYCIAVAKFGLKNHSQHSPTVTLIENLMHKAAIDMKNDSLAISNNTIRYGDYDLYKPRQLRVG